MKLVLPSSALAFLVAFPTLAAAQRGNMPPSGTRPAQFRLIWHEDPAHQAIMAWTTEDSGRSRVYYDTQSRGGNVANYAQNIDCGDSRRYSGLTLHHYHHCALSSLQPSTRYYLVLQTENDRSEEFYFETAPADDRAFKLLFGGDSRSDSRQRRIMNQRMAALVAADPTVMGLAHGGDYVATGTSWSDWTQWLTDHELTITADGRLLPVIPARGNHEARGSLYDQIWATPGGNGKNYFTTIIGNFWLVTLNSEISQGGDQRVWLERQLQMGVNRARWITAQYHRPAWPAVKSPGNALRHWVPLFEQYNADLIFESDGHALKRTVPIRNNQQDPTGVVYVGEGGLGVSQRTPESDRWYLQSPGFTTSAHHVQVLSVSPMELVYEVIAADGSNLDTYRMNPRRMAGPIEIVAPAQGEVLTPGSSYSLQWSSQLSSIANVDLHYTVDGGANWLPIAQNVANQGQYSWMVPTMNHAEVRLRVRDSAQTNLEGLSPLFSISSRQVRTVIPWGASWRYDASNTDHGNAWQQEAFDESAWAQGTAQLGYGDGDEATEINADADTPSIYFRHRFQLPIGTIHQVDLSVLHDDGVAVFVNGQNALEKYVDDGLGHSDYASSGSDDNERSTVQLMANLLKAGENVVAVVVKQRSSRSSDLSFDLQLSVGIEEPIMQPTPDAGVVDTGVQVDGGVVPTPDSGVMVPPDSGVTTPDSGSQPAVDTGVVAPTPDAGSLEPTSEEGGCVCSHSSAADTSTVLWGLFATFLLSAQLLRRRR